MTDLINEILDQLPSAVWTSTSTTFLDPAMGGGQFASAIEQRLAAHGHSRDNISKRVFGYEQEQFLIDLSRNLHDLVGQYDKLSYNDILGADKNMKFDVVVGNPPFQDMNLNSSGDSHRSGGSNPLARKFFQLSLGLARSYVALIGPYNHRTYSDAISEEYKKEGLYRIDKCEEHFPQISSNPCVFYFDINSPSVTVINEMLSTLEIPDDNLSKRFMCQPGKLRRKDFEDKLLDSGQHRFIVTTSIIRYSNDDHLVDSMKDRSRGHWRVVFNEMWSVKSIGKIIIAEPDDVLGSSVNCFIVDSKDDAEAIYQFLQSKEATDIISAVKTSSTNSKKFLKYLRDPLITQP